MPSASKTTTLYSNSGNAYYLTASFTETGTNTANNTSDISCTATLSPTNAYWGTSYASTLAIYWHDNRQNTDVYLNSISFSGINSGETKSVTGATTVYHRDDGTLSGYAYAIFTKGSTTSSYAPNSGSVATDWTGLTNIDRYPMITSAPDFSDEDNPTVAFTTNVGFTDYITEIAIKHNWDDDPLANYRQVVVANGSYTFNLTNTERNALRNETPNSNTMTVIFSLRTTVGNDVYFSTITRTLSIVNADPTFTHSEVETNSNVISVLGSSSASQVIQNASEIDVTISPTALKGATITSVKVNSGGYSETKTTSPYVFAVPVTQQSFGVVVRDSRGNSKTSIFTKSMIAYSPISFNSFSFERENPTSSNIIVDLDSNYYQQTFGSSTNVPIVKWKLDDGTYTTIPSTEYTIDTTNHKLTITSYELTNALVYTSKGTFTLEVSDLLSSFSDTQDVLKGIPTFDYGEHDLKVNGDLFVADINGENAYKIYNSFKYSTTETVVGIWINNKPIYRKVINFTNTSTNWQTIDTITNMDEVVTLKGYVYDGGNNKTAIPSYGTDSVKFYITSAGAVNKQATSYYQNKTGVLILEYTKTSD